MYIFTTLANEVNYMEELNTALYRIVCHALVYIEYYFISPLGSDIQYSKPELNNADLDGTIYQITSVYQPPEKARILYKCTDYSIMLHSLSIIHVYNRLFQNIIWK